MRVLELWRHPVKSFQGERLDGAELVADGLAADRSWGVLDTETGKVLTGRRAPAAPGVGGARRRRPSHDVAPRRHADERAGSRHRRGAVGVAGPARLAGGRRRASRRNRPRCSPTPPTTAATWSSGTCRPAASSTCSRCSCSPRPACAPAPRSTARGTGTCAASAPTC